jgi:ribosomal protein S3
MSRKKNTLSLNISKNKNWNNSWSSYIQEEYKTMFQEDIILQSYFRSQLKDYEKINIVNLRFYRVNKLLLIDIGISCAKFLNKKILLKLTSFLAHLSKFFEKDTWLAIHKPVFLDLLNNGFNIALKIAKLIERRIKFRSRLVKTLLKKIKKNSRGIYVQCKGRINNVDMAKVDKLYLGSLPLQSLNLSISYGLVIANTFKGLQSIKVWICK